MTITASDVKTIRERTQAPMMDCKRALQEAAGDMEQAITLLRERGQAKASKRSGRATAEGAIAAWTSEDGSHAYLIEVNCETDFVANSDPFQEFISILGNILGSQNITSLEELLAAEYKGSSVDTIRQELIAKVGENVNIPRLKILAAGDKQIVASYVHSNNQIGVLTCLNGGTTELGRDIAMHVAAMRPVAVHESEVDQEIVAKERAIFEAQAQESGKPAEIIEKMVQGKVQKFLADICLVGQSFVKDSNVKVGQLLRQNDSDVVSFVRYSVGETMEASQ